MIEITDIDAIWSLLKDPERALNIELASFAYDIMRKLRSGKIRYVVKE
jgi:hypothetical protein